MTESRQTTSLSLPHCQPPLEIHGPQVVENCKHFKWAWISYVLATVSSQASLSKYLLGLYCENQSCQLIYVEPSNTIDGSTKLLSALVETNAQRWSFFVGSRVVVRKANPQCMSVELWVAACILWEMYPAFGKTFDKCHQLNHFAKKCCGGKDVKAVEENDEIDTIDIPRTSRQVKPVQLMKMEMKCSLPRHLVSWMTHNVSRYKSKRAVSDWHWCTLQCIACCTIQKSYRWWQFDPHASK